MSGLAEVLAHVAKVTPDTATAWLDGQPVPAIDDLELASVALVLGVEDKVSLRWSNMRRPACQR